MRQRVIWLDYARALAIICVVITHTTERVYNLSAAELLQNTGYSRIFAISMFTIGRLGVPIFFFLTGFLVLGKEYNGEKAINFYAQNVGGLLITTEIWILLYNVFDTCFYGEARY